MASHAPKACRVELFGGLRLCAFGIDHVRFRTQKTAGLLATLAYRLGRPVTRDELIEMLWPDSSSEQARNSLSQSVSSLRHQLEPSEAPPGAVLEAGKDFLRLRTESCSTDVDDFRTLMRSARSGGAELWRSRAEAAAALIPGELLPGSTLGWVFVEREALREDGAALLEELAEDAAKRGELLEALGYALQAATVDPLRESSRQHAIRLFQALGQPAGALRQYKQYARILRDELGLRPLDETRQLVLETTAPGVKPLEIASLADTPVSTLAPLAPRLPAPVAQFFGRVEDLAAIGGLLASGERLVTLRGPGGIGKSRLSLEAGRAAESGYADGAWFVPLAEATTPAGFWAALRSALGVPGSKEPDAVTALAFLSERTSLLILDNFEQLIDVDGAAEVARLLGDCPRVAVLVSSRQRLMIDGEREWELGPLATSGAAVDLFYDRARSVKADFADTPESRESVSTLCGLLEGVPLAIELAASRVHVLSVGRMVERIDERLDLLASRAKVGRHRSLRAAVSWSFDMLSPTHRSALCRLAVFRGGIGLDAAEAVLDVAVPIDIVADLCGYSLLRSLDTPSGDVRFSMLETIREFAVDTSGETLRADAEIRHGMYVAELVERFEPTLEGPLQVDALDRLDLELGNLDAAISSAARRGDPETALRIGAAAWRFWHLRSHVSHGRLLLAKALEVDGGPNRARARALNGAGRLAYLQGEYDFALAAHSEALALARDDKTIRASCEAALGAVAYEQGRYSDAMERFTASHQLSVALGDAFKAGNALSWIGIVATEIGDFTLAERTLLESLEIRRKSGDLGGVARSLNSLGVLARQTGDPAAAESLYSEALELQRRLGDQRASAGILSNLGMLASARGDLEAARSLFDDAYRIHSLVGDRWGQATVIANLADLDLATSLLDSAWTRSLEALRLRQAIGNPWGVLLSLEGCAEVLAAKDLPIAAARLLGLAASGRTKIGSPRAPADQAKIDDLEARLREALGDSEFRKALHAGTQEDLSNAATLAAELGGPG